LKLLLDITQLGIQIGLAAQNVILDLASYPAFFPILADMIRSKTAPSSCDASSTCT